VIELYGITDHPGPPLPDVAQLTAVGSDGLAAVCAPAGPPEVSAEALWRHEEVVEALMQDRDVLPVRFGTRLEDESAAARAVGERHDELSLALERIRGAVELSLRVLSPGAGPSGAAADEDGPGELGSGADYMRAKTRLAVERERAVERLHEPLAVISRASVQGSPHGSSELLRAAYLVERPAVHRFVGLVGRLEQSHPELRLLCTGPWPPYSFTSA
jgi:gas vesicle protein GvpL/GvpF